MTGLTAHAALCVVSKLHQIIVSIRAQQIIQNRFIRSFMHLPTILIQYGLSKQVEDNVLTEFMTALPKCFLLYLLFTNWLRRGYYVIIP